MNEKEFVTEYLFCRLQAIPAHPNIELIIRNAKHAYKLIQQLENVT